MWLRNLARERRLHGELEEAGRASRRGRNELTVLRVDIDGIPNHGGSGYCTSCGLATSSKSFFHSALSQLISFSSTPSEKPNSAILATAECAH